MSFISCVLAWMSWTSCTAFCQSLIGIWFHHLVQTGRAAAVAAAAQRSSCCSLSAWISSAGPLLCAQDNCDRLTNALHGYTRLSLQCTVRKRSHEARGAMWQELKQCYPEYTSPVIIKMQNRKRKTRHPQRQKCQKGISIINTVRVIFFIHLV